MARYQAGESRCRLCCLFDGPGDTATQPALATGSESHPDAPFHTTSADSRDATTTAPTQMKTMRQQHRARRTTEGAQPRKENTLQIPGHQRRH